MNVKRTVWDNLTVAVIILLVFAALTGVALWYYPLFQQNERMRREILRLDAQIQRQGEHGRQLKTSIDALRYDPRAVERLARERLGYAKPGETVIRFEPVPATLSAAP